MTRLYYTWSQLATDKSQRMDRKKVDALDKVSKVVTRLAGWVGFGMKTKRLL